MKAAKLGLILLALASLPAVAAPGLYIQGDAAYAKLKIKDDGGSDSNNGFAPRLSVGYDFDNNIRAAVDYTHYKPEKYSETTDYYHEHGKIKFNSIGVSAFYDFDVHPQLKPYVGARLSVNRVDAKDYYESASSQSSYSYRKTKTGIGALAGVGFNVTDNVTLDAGYRYNYWGKFDEAKLHTHEASFGVRVKF